MTPSDDQREAAVTKIIQSRIDQLGDKSWLTVDYRVGYEDGVRAALSSRPALPSPPAIVAGDERIEKALHALALDYPGQGWDSNLNGGHERWASRAREARAALASRPSSPQAGDGPSKCPSCGSDDKRYRFGRPCFNQWHGEWLTKDADNGYITPAQVADERGKLIAEAKGWVRDGPFDTGANLIQRLLAALDSDGQEATR